MHFRQENWIVRKLKLILQKKIEADLTQLQKMNGKKEMLGEGGIKLHR